MIPPLKKNLCGNQYLPGLCGFPADMLFFSNGYGANQYEY